MTAPCYMLVNANLTVGEMLETVDYFQNDGPIS